LQGILLQGVCCRGLCCRLCTCEYISMYDTYMFVCTYMYVCIFTFARVLVLLTICMYVCMYVCLYKCMYEYMYVCLYVCTYVILRVCTYINIHSLNCLKDARTTNLLHTHMCVSGRGDLSYKTLADLQQVLTGILEGSLIEDISIFKCCPLHRRLPNFAIRMSCACTHALPFRCCDTTTFRFSYENIALLL